MYIQTSNKYKKLLKTLRHCTDEVELLRILQQMLITPKYSKEVGTSYDGKTGECLKSKWVLEKDSIPTSLIFYPTYGSISSTTLHPNLITKLKSHLKNNKEPILYLPKSSNELVNNNIALLVTVENVAIGGDHNDATSYGDVLKFRLVPNMYKIL